MEKTACQYAIVRFSPFVETGEFANVGVVMICPEKRFFGFKLQIERYGRVTKFFSELESQVYRNSMKILRDELKRTRSVLMRHGFDKRLKNNNQEFARNMFSELTRSRETMIKFSDARLILSSDPKQAIEETFRFYVQRNFVTKKYRETIVERQLSNWFRIANIADKFVRDKIGDEIYQVKFPFVEKTEERNRTKKVIKTLNLGHDDPVKILDHGGSWLFKMAELKDRRVLPERVLFTVDEPKGKVAFQSRARAYEKIVSKLDSENFEVISYKESNRQKILEFAGS